MALLFSMMSTSQASSSSNLRITGNDLRGGVHRGVRSRPQRQAYDLGLALFATFSAGKIHKEAFCGLLRKKPRGVFSSAHFRRENFSDLK